jgi:hypothetical protein
MLAPISSGYFMRALGQGRGALKEILRNHGTTRKQTCYPSIEFGFRRAVVATHRHVLPTHSHERRPYPDVGHPHVAVVDQFQFFHKLIQARVLPSSGPAVRDFGVSLVILGVVMLVSGIAYHVAFMRGLRATRNRLVADGLIHGESVFPVSLTLIVAILMLLIGLFAIANMVFHFEPFG